jgi:hypothetical protein
MFSWHNSKGEFQCITQRKPWQIALLLALRVTAAELNVCGSACMGSG